MNGAKVLLVGCGQLGSRHLQALAALPDISEVHVADPSIQSLELGKSRLSEAADSNPSTRFFWHEAPADCCSAAALGIVATQARGRAALIRSLAETLGVTRFLVEKVVTQSVEEYEQLLEFSRQRNLEVWVNCKSRAYGFHQYVKSKLDPVEPVIVSAIGGNGGLANNGIHAADLFSFYDGSRTLELVGKRVEPVLLPSKRGSDVFDLAGSLYGSSEKGSDFILSFSSRHEAPEVVSIQSPRGRFFIDHFQKFAFESTAENQWRWTSIPISEDWTVSHMSRQFVHDILMKDSCALPTLKQCFPAHRFILEALLPHFNQLRGVEEQLLPIT